MCVIKLHTSVYKLSLYTYELTVSATFKEYGHVTSLNSLPNQSSRPGSAAYRWTAGTQVLHVLALSCSLWHCISGFYIAEGCRLGLFYLVLQYFSSLSTGEDEVLITPRCLRESPPRPDQ